MYHAPVTPLARKLLLLALLVLGLLAVFGHAVFWYLPRERARTPDAGDVPARLLVSDAYDNALWLPYPHQNLGEMAEAVGDPEGWLAAAARVADVPPPEGRRFGPFSVPPAREVTLAADEDGERAMVAARMYPLIAAVARLAGKVAGNPWLGGGTVEVDGRPAEVAWDGTLWTVRRGPEPNLPSEAYPPYEPLLGAVSLGQAHDLFPSGLYALRRTETGALELSTGRAEGRRPETGSLSRAGVSLALFDAAGPPLEMRPSALLLFDRETDRMVNLPAAAVLFSKTAGPVTRSTVELEDAEARETERIRDAFLNGGEPEAAVDVGSNDDPNGRLRLPQERLPKLLRGTLREGEAAGFHIVASDRSALEDAGRLAPEIAPMLHRNGAGAAVWLTPGPVLGLVDQAVEVLEKVPLLSSSDLQEWRDWRTVLLPLGNYERIYLVRSVDPEAFDLVLD